MNDKHLKRLILEEIQKLLKEQDSQNNSDYQECKEISKNNKIVSYIQTAGLDLESGNFIKKLNIALNKSRSGDIADIKSFNNWNVYNGLKLISYFSNCSGSLGKNMAEKMVTDNCKKALNILENNKNPNTNILYNNIKTILNATLMSDMTARRSALNNVKSI